ncbi:MAG: hypothetical protein EOM52_01835 [Clostridia bacterium]|nr:hypothetical protein [Clostridia bacterium]
MCDQTGRVVRSLAGHDRGDLYYVVGEEDEFLFLANGKQRKVSSPKRKKLRHTAEEGTVSLTAPVTDGRLRAALAVFRNQGGN